MTKKVEPTHLNRWVLAQVFGTAERVSNRQAATHYTHLKRCLAGGLIVVEGAEMVLTAEGKKVVAEEAAKAAKWSKA